MLYDGVIKAADVLHYCNYPKTLPSHRLFSSQSVGLLVVGYDFANSYGYLGGVGVRAINPIIVVK